MPKEGSLQSHSPCDGTVKSASLEDSSQVVASAGLFVGMYELEHIAADEVVMLFGQMCCQHRIRHQKV